MSYFVTERRTLATSVVFYAVVLCVSFVSHGDCQVTPAPAPCSLHTSCDTCVPQPRCLWCFSTNNCTEYPVNWLLPPGSLCPLSQARWGVCWINFEALIITLGVLAGVILIIIVVCCCYCCCCCCCKKHRTGPDCDEERLARRREEIRQRSEERKMERNVRHNEIRRKYGLMGDADHPYSKFENE